MKFELIEFYPLDPDRKVKKGKLLGSIHVYVYFGHRDFQFDLRGILVFKRGKKLHFQLPGASSFDSDTKEKIRYPFFSFTRQEDHQAFLAFLDKEVTPFIREKLNLSST